MTYQSKSLIALASAAFLATSFAASAEEAIFAAWLPPKHPTVIGGAETFTAGVTAESGGAMTFKLITGGALLGAKDTVSGLSDGLASMGQVAFSYYPAEFPHSTLAGEMAILGSNPLAIAAATTEFSLLACEPCQAEFKAAGIVSFGNASTGAYELITTKPVTSVDDIRGLKIRAPGLLWERWIESVGAVSVSVPASETYENISRGQLDGSMTSVGSLKSLSLWDETKYVTMIGLGSFRSWGVLSAGESHWAGLSLEMRRIYLNNAAAGILGTSRAYMAKDAVARDESKEKNVTFLEPGETLLAASEAFLASDRATIIENAKNDMGIADPEPLMDVYAALIIKWEEKYAGLSVDDDFDTMVQMLKEEVYDTLDAATYGQ
ncbi:MAG: C4-dicarboxylate TRAP transporter substrate-binding protein [Rhodobacteraceae bacterium]|nr:C4-dicarboxylate TRAP transporter substrate-binding protein [Paracoccaceae bacterium]